MIEVRSEKRGNHCCTEKKIQETNVTENPNSQTATNVESEKRIFIPNKTAIASPKPSFKEEKWYGNYIASLAYFLATVVFFFAGHSSCVSSLCEPYFHILFLL
jgi:hypothetical protein